MFEGIPRVACVAHAQRHSAVVARDHRFARFLIQHVLDVRAVLLRVCFGRIFVGHPRLFVQGKVHGVQYLLPDGFETSSTFVVEFVHVHPQKFLHPESGVDARRKAQLVAVWRPRHELAGIGLAFVFLLIRSGEGLDVDQLDVLKRLHVLQLRVTCWNDRVELAQNLSPALIVGGRDSHPRRRGSKHSSPGRGRGRHRGRGRSPSFVREAPALREDQVAKTLRGMDPAEVREAFERVQVWLLLLDAQFHPPVARREDVERDGRDFRRVAEEQRP
mmetsp:Transcript_25694/g.61355  ORF Transcript_25694/g.61355 Transcript_25694/m.61355 type:complete len:274 (+) Transcript_25694:248-1069(+)